MVLANESILTYWLIPAEPARTHLASLINDLASRFDAPSFEPHVTIYVTKAGDDDPAEVLTAVLNTPGTYQLSLAGIRCSEKFTKTLFVEFRQSDALARLTERLRAASTSGCPYQLEPHLSLLYKKMPDEEKARIAGSIRLPFQKIEFASVKAVVSPAPVETSEDVEAWRVVASKELPQ